MPSTSEISSTRPAFEARPFAIMHVAAVDPTPPERTWLVDKLWLASGVGILAGHAKCGKTFMAVELATAVAGNTPALGCFKPAQSGSVLFYGAEDSLPALRTRFEGLAKIKGLLLKDLPVYLLAINSLRLDKQADLHRLRATIAALSPRLLVLDPFVRMANIDENSAADVAAVLASLRDIQRTYDIAIILVHHARKSPAAHPMQAFRGSSDFSAWSDTNMHLARKTSRLVLSIEHRSAPAPEPLALVLRAEPAPHMVVLDAQQNQQDNTTTNDTLTGEIQAMLQASARPLTTVDIRQRLAKRKADVVAALEQLRAQGVLQRQVNGWMLEKP